MLLSAKIVVTIMVVIVPSRLGKAIAIDLHMLKSTHLAQMIIKYGTAQQIDYLIIIVIKSVKKVIASFGNLLLDD